MDAVELEKKLRAAIEAELELCENRDVPIVCGMLSTEKDKEILIKEIKRRIIQQRITIEEAIVQYDNEYNPNTLD